MPTPLAVINLARQAERLEMRVLKGETTETEQTVSRNNGPILLNLVRFPMFDAVEK